MIHNHFDIQGIICSLIGRMLPPPTIVDPSETDDPPPLCWPVTCYWTWQKWGYPIFLKFSPEGIDYQTSLEVYDRSGWFSEFEHRIDLAGAPEKPKIPVKSFNARRLRKLRKDQ